MQNIMIRLISLKSSQRSEATRMIYKIGLLLLLLSSVLYHIRFKCGLLLLLSMPISMLLSPRWGGSSNPGQKVTWTKWPPE